MPTTQFFNLPQEKRRKLITAARKEFSRTTFNNASINKIVADADISRGSFYLYFYNKKDLAYYIMQDFSLKILNKSKTILEENNGDVFILFTEIFEIALSHCAKNSDNFALMKNLFASMHSNSVDSENEIDMHEMFHKNKDMFNLEEFVKLVHTDDLIIQNDDELNDLMMILFFILKFSLTHALIGTDDLSKAKERFVNRINIVRYGVMKK